MLVFAVQSVHLLTKKYVSDSTVTRLQNIPLRQLYLVH